MAPTSEDSDLFLAASRVKNFSSSFQIRREGATATKRLQQRSPRICSSSFSNIPENSRLPPLRLQGARARRSRHSRKLSTLEPSSTKDMYAYDQNDLTGQWLYSGRTSAPRPGSQKPLHLESFDQAQDSSTQTHRNDSFIEPPTPFRDTFLNGTATTQSRLYSPSLSYMPGPNPSLNIYQPPSAYDNFYEDRENVLRSPARFTPYEDAPYRPSDQYSLPSYREIRAPHHYYQNQPQDRRAGELGVEDWNSPSYFQQSPYLDDSAPSSSHTRDASNHSCSAQTSPSDAPPCQRGTDEDEDPDCRIIQQRKVIKPRPQMTPPATDSAHSSPCTKKANGLYYNNFVEAEAAAFSRARSLLHDDDWTEVKINPAEHVLKLLYAFKGDYAKQPEQFALPKASDKSRWIAYQDGHVEKMDKYDDRTLEAACWVLLKHLIEAHELGMKALRYHKVENNIKCSDHVDLVASAIRKYAVIRYDVVRLQRLDELVCCTTSAVSRKIANFRGNWNKTERENENKQNAEAHGIKYVPVLGDKKKRTFASALGDGSGAPAVKKSRGKKKVGDVE
ncbi:hypothetical protein CKM354_000497700 [Cercospora kikuchii]|uniref:Uncharacterized protein n=1 Tax=Cercospora kikuchii TaxID=84275 RepID=A0A9P3CCF0_9PEZI|nr:uncharacterized protein CKM354_000497700 [Cercospora kikuchii]GIZ41679.1 hypothetical protein CKM354_000497700 [Cercospora kikuchii]